MMRKASAILLILLVGCTSQGSRRLDDAEPNALILISLDGFRWDYQQKTATPTLDRLAADGVRAKGLIPVFPTKTFPNHYSIVTGLYPEHHGIVSNNMYDPALDAEFSLSLREEHGKAGWWQGEPIWVTAVRQGKKAASMFWPGSEAPIEGIRPTYWTPYDHDFPNLQRVDQVLAWLDLPADQRPAFITCYFSLVDSASHDFGPDSEEAEESIRQADALMGRLLEGLEQRGLLHRVHILIVSDHGAAATGPDRVLYLDDHLDLKRVRVVDLNPVAMLIPEADYLEGAYWALQGVPHLSVHRREEMPERFHYRHNPRIPPLIAIADEGWTIARRDQPPEDVAPGSHGYDNLLQSMQGIFIAHGPAFRTGAVIEPFSCLDLYPLMTLLLGLQPASNDGDLKAVRPLLKESFVPRGQVAGGAAR